MQYCPKYELVVYRDLGDGDLQIQMAINGTLAPMIDDHKRSLERFNSDNEYFAHVARQSELLIHLYGDARYPLPESEVLRRSQEGF